MVRTQVYLSEKEKFEIEQIARLSGKSQSEILRDAVDQYIILKKSKSWKEKISVGRGIWEKRDDLPDFDKIRKEMDQRIL